MEVRRALDLPNDPILSKPTYGPYYMSPALTLSERHLHIFKEDLILFLQQILPQEETILQFTSGSISGYIERYQSVQHANYFYFLIHPSGYIAVDIRHTYFIFI
jgi:hypothetical protein